ncbi:MFS transporter [Bordetella avium]|nr:MFS transporter [Bordetella avium]AZY52351.1 MFS transporter [Bordetella avium]RIQ14233.1 MFS transporter [Bordetella avium]RIQ18108.1 MFS transporter [Bordetella avium]RIQ36581.1 MFS transporter [Bordetella avium]
MPFLSMQNSVKIYLLSFISFLIGTAEYIVAGILDQIALDLQLPVAVVGQLITVFSIAFAVGTPVLITMTAQADRKKVLICAMLVFALVNLATVGLTHYTWLNVARAASGLSGGVMEVLLLTLAAALAPSGKKGNAIAMVVIGFSAALVVGVPLGRLVSTTADWRWVFGGIGALTLLSLVLVAFTIPATQGEAAMPLSQQLKLLKNRQVSSIYLITFFWISAFSIIYSYISPFLLRITHMTDGQISIMLLVCGLASILGSKLGGRVADRSGYAATLTGGLIAHVFTLLGFLCFGQTAGMVCALLILWSIAAWSSGPALQLRLIVLAPQSTSIVFSFYSSILQLGMAAGAIAGGLAIQAGWLAGLPGVGAVSIVLALWLLRNTRRSGPSA